MSPHDSGVFVESLLQSLQDALTQIQSQASILTSKTNTLNDWLDLLRESPEELKIHSQQREHDSRVAKQTACTIYSSIGHEAFMLFASTILISAICERKVTNQFVPAFRGWWQRQTSPPLLQLITTQKRKEHQIDKLVSKCDQTLSRRLSRRKKRGIPISWQRCRLGRSVGSVRLSPKSKIWHVGRVY